MKKLFRNSFKDIYYQICAEITSDLLDLKAGKIKAPGKLDKALIGGSAIIGSIAGSANVAFAGRKPELFTTAENLLKDYYGYFIVLSTLVAVVASVIALIYCMISGQEGTKKAFSYVKKIVLCWFIINLIGGFIGIFSDLTRGQQFDVNAY